jgi:hypothetical protein
VLEFSPAARTPSKTMKSFGSKEKVEDDKEDLDLFERRLRFLLSKREEAARKVRGIMNESEGGRLAGN